MDRDCDMCLGTTIGVDGHSCEFCPAGRQRNACPSCPDDEGCNRWLHQPQPA